MCVPFETKDLPPKWPRVSSVTPPHPAWIALVFGGDPFSIKSARAKLIEDGWFARLETPQRVRQRYGEWVVIIIIEPPVENHDETEPPLQNQSLSDEIETN